MKTLFSLLLTVLVSTSAFAQWELTTPVKTRSEFPQIQMINDQIGYTIDRPMGTILKTNNGGVNWKRLANNITSQPRALFMWDEQRGIVISGQGTIIRSLDGFVTTSTSLNPTYGHLSCVDFINDTLGWIGTETGKIYRSIDAGETWTLMTSGLSTSNVVTAIQFLDEQVGYASAIGEEILKSTDGGLTWQGVGPFDQLILIYDIHFIDASVGVGVGSAGDVIRTTDGGATWDSIPSNTTYSMRDLAAQGNTMLACGDWGRTIRSTDAGLTWTEIQVGNADHQSVALTPNGIAILGTDGRIQGSTDLGQTWSTLIEGTWHTLINKISFGNNSNGAAVGWQSTGGFEAGLLRTVDGGRNWLKAGTGGLGVHVNADGDGCRGGGVGSFARTSDNFGTIQNINGPDVAIRCTWTFNELTHLVGGGAVQGGIYRTTNGGSSWTHVLNVGNITISDLFFVDDMQGYAVGEYGDNYRTMDGGITWTPLPPTSGSHTVFFIDALHGWTNNHRTLDGGDSWIQMGGTPQTTRSIFFTDLDTGYAVAYSGRTERSVDGGVTWSNIFPEIFNAGINDAAYVNGYIVMGGKYGDIYRAQIGCSSVAEIPNVTVAGQSLCTTLQGSIQWYINGDAITEATNSCYNADQSGMYHVVVIDDFGCASAPSEPVQIVITGVADMLSERSVILSPNPVTDLLQMDRSNDGSATVLFSDAQGRTVSTQRIAGLRSTIDVSGLIDGVYFVRVVEANKNTTLRLVKH